MYSHAVAALTVICCAISIPAFSAATERDIIELSYQPEKRLLTVVVPRNESRPPSTPNMPDWLTRGDDTTEGEAVFRGTLPRPGPDNPLRGATQTDAFLFGALAWLPRTTEENLEILLTTPASHRAVATGALLSENLTATHYSARFRLYGRPGENGLFFGPYEVATGEATIGQRPVALRTYFKPAQAEHSQAYLEATGRYVSRYAENIGSYGYESFAVISAPIPVGYGLPGATFVAEQILGHPYMLGRSLAHEVLHAWWGGTVGVDYESGNWAEGLTTYQADHALAAERDPEAAKAMRRDWLSALTSMPRDADRPVRSFVSAGHDRDQSVGYGKSALIFHMLGRRLGVEVFRAGLAAFYADHRGDVAGWPDLQSAFEDVAGEPLGPFFSQWLDRTGLPLLRPVRARVARRDAEFVVTVAIEQEGDLYQLDVPVVVETETGAVTETVRLDGRSVSAEIAVQARPVAVAVDPDFDLARQLLDGELPPTIRDVGRAGSVTLVTGAEASAAGAALARSLLGKSDELPRSRLQDPVLDAHAVIAVGTTEAIAAFREAQIDREFPAAAEAGQSRLWVERDERGRVWLFASSDSVDTLDEKLAQLRYYGGQSFLVIDDGRVTETGRWPVQDSPMRLLVK